MEQHTVTTEASLRLWLGTCSASERETLAQLWGVPLPNTSGAAATALADAMLTPSTVARLLTALSPQERAALERVIAEGGCIKATLLEREFGPLRPHEHYPSPRTYLLALPTRPSATERLFILGLIHPKQQNRQRRYCIPSDLLALLPAVPPRDRTLHLPEAAAPPNLIAANVWYLEYTIVMILTLAQAGALEMLPERGLSKASMLRLAKRWGMSKDELRGITYEQHWTYVYFLRLVLQSAGLLRIAADQKLRPGNATLEWLKAPRLERLRQLLTGWVISDWDELKRLLFIEMRNYPWDRDLAATRRAILALLAAVPPQRWIAWPHLLDEVQRVDPDFARPEGNYDTWRLFNHRGQSLDGYANWRAVEGELLKASIGTSLHWLGLTDLGSEAANNGVAGPVVAFRLNEYGAALLTQAVPPSAASSPPLRVQGTFEVVVPPRAAPFDHFQISRIAVWSAGSSPDEATIYKLTKASVQAAVEQGISAEAMLSFLEQASASELPPNVAYSLREWAGKQGQITLRRAAVLQVEDPLLLEQLRRDRRIRLPPIEAVGADTWLLGEADAAALAQALRKAGYGLAGTIASDASALKERDLTVLAAALRFYVNACASLQIESDTSDAMIQRITRLLTQHQRDSAERIAATALSALEQHLHRKDG